MANITTGLSVLFSSVLGSVIALILSFLFLFLCIFRSKTKFRLTTTIVCGVIGVALMAVGVCLTVYGLKDMKWDSWTGSYHYTTVRPTGDFKELTIDLYYADVEVSLGDDFGYTLPEELRYEATESDSARFTITQTQRPYRHKAAPDVKIILPQDKELSFTLFLNAGNVTVTGGSFDSFTVKAEAGNITLQRVIAEKLRMEINAGNIETTDCKGEKAECFTNAGTISFQNGRFDAVTAETDMGDIECFSLSADDLSLKSALGSIDGTIDGVESEYTVSVHVAMGSSFLHNHAGTTKKRLQATCSMGSISLLFENGGAKE